jgi:hypothetical protein
MKIAALITWLLTAGGGFFMLATWIRNGGVRQSQNSKFPPALIFGHFALAATGLIVWILYVITDTDSLAWVAFIILLPVALLGFGMLARWIPTHRAEQATAATRSSDTVAAADKTPESHFPVPTVIAHGLLAVVTLVLVLLTATGVGGS